jgi:hypothetical protein
MGSKDALEYIIYYGFLYQLNSGQDLQSDGPRSFLAQQFFLLWLYG